jgi:sirohydrochlorin cobaltochelatase
MQFVSQEPENKSAAMGALLIGHGTREPEGISEFHSTVQQVFIAWPEIAVEPCFLEIAEPSIESAVKRLLERGVAQIVVMPLLLFAAGHAKRDVPMAVAEALRPYPQIAWQQAEHLGCHAAILEQSASRFQEALANRTAVPSQRTALLLVGRGSLDPEATSEMHEFASLLPQARLVDAVHLAFVAMAQPSLEEILEQIAEKGYERVIVQPHLLFDGLLLGRIGEIVAEFACRQPQTDWVVSGHLGLGPTPAVARAVAERMDVVVARFRNESSRSACGI